jgi:phosphoglycolate phosphatase
MQPDHNTHLSAELKSKITSLVFDLDGTLIDSSPGIESSLAAAFATVGRIFPRVDIRQAIGPPIRIIARRIEPSLTDAELDGIEPSYRSHYDTEGWRQTVLFDGVTDTLRSLHALGLRLFIVTNKPRIPTDNILNHLQLHSLFSDTFTRDSRPPAFTSKSEMLAALMQQHQLASASTLMIGDTSEDQEAAHANRLQFLYVTYGYGAVDSSPLQITNFPDLITLLDRPSHQGDRTSS